MSRADVVASFVQAALAAGWSRPEIRAALARAGWTEREINRGLRAFDEQDFLPPVPRPQPHLTAREAFVYAPLFTALAVAASALVSLIHAILDIRMPDPQDEPAMAEYRIGTAQWAIALIVVWTPIYLWMTFVADRWLRRDPSRRTSPVRKWLTYVALFLSGTAFLGDAVYSVFSFLQGEFTTRVMLKALTVAVVSGAIFAVYLRGIEERDDG